MERCVMFDPHPSPYALRVRQAAAFAGISRSELYKRLDLGLYQSFKDGSARMVVVQSIIDHQKRCAAMFAVPPKTTEAVMRAIIATIPKEEAAAEPKARATATEAKEAAA
jgi:hypothetical protein